MVTWLRPGNRDRRDHIRQVLWYSPRDFSNGCTLTVGGVFEIEQDNDHPAGRARGRR